MQLLEVVRKEINENIILNMVMSYLKYLIRLRKFKLINVFK